MFSKTKSFVFFIVFCFSFATHAESLSSIMKAHEDKVVKAKKTYDASVKKSKQYTLRKLESLKKSTTRAGKLEEAIEIQNEINRLEGKAPMDGPKEAGGEAIGGGIPVPPGEDAATFSEKQAGRLLRKRYIDFYTALIESKFEKASEYLDPSIRKAVDKKIIEGHLRIIAGFLQAGQVKKGAVDISRLKFSKKQKEAKITGKIRSSFSGHWEDNKDPNYWIYKRGEWYLGDEKELKKLF